VGGAKQGYVRDTHARPVRPGLFLIGAAVEDAARRMDESKVMCIH
jgi:hypothetical protein